MVLKVWYASRQRRQLVQYTLATRANTVHFYSVSIGYIVRLYDRLKCLYLTAMRSQMIIQTLRTRANTVHFNSVSIVYIVRLYARLNA